MKSLLLLVSALSLLQAQPKALTPADYAQFESLPPFPPSISPDGKWVAYVVQRSDRTSELRIANLASGETKTAAFGSQPAFSSDSKWLAYSIGMSEMDEEKLKKDKKPVHHKLGLMDLSKGEQSSIDGVELFAFSPNGGYLAMKRYAPEKPSPPAEPDPDAPPAGATLIVRNLAKGTDSTFGNVGEFAWQDTPRTGRLLAIAISAEDKTGNGIQLFDPESGNLRVLDSGAAVFSGLAWRKKSADLAALRSKSDDARQGLNQVLLSWTHLSEPSEAAHRLEPALAADQRTVPYRKPSWSDDGNIVFLGTGTWDKKPPKKDPKDTSAADDQPGVDVWHYRDPIVMAKQKIDAKNDKRRNLLAAWNLSSNKLVALQQNYTERISPLKHHDVAYAATWTKYAMERSIGRPAADLSLVDLKSGERTKIKEAVRDDSWMQASPGGRYLVFVQDDAYWTVNTETRAVTNITKGVTTSFIDKESDFTVRQKPPFGVAGWTRDDKAVLLYDKFDIWRVAPDGSGATRLTDGAKDEVRHRYVRLDPEEEFIDTDKPVYLSLFGIWSKKSGYARLTAKGEEHLVLADRMVARLAKARDAETFVFSTETYEQSPQIFTSGATLAEPKQISKLNPFQSNYVWGRSELIEYKDNGGHRLQGSLYYPAGYEAGKRYPMVVYIYERLSDGLHRFIAPSEREYYNATALVERGYFVLMPDIVFQAREPGVSMMDCVTTAVKTVVAKGAVDPKRVGVMGHSWGGFDTTFLATHSNVFAAGVAGAPITDLVSNYGNHHWTSGIAETDHIETGQQRMEVPLWEDLPAYIRNSAVFNAQNMTTPLLIEVGDADGTVFYHQGVELYNVARRAGKNVVLLVYAGEDHGLRKKPNQIDYQRRLHAWFDHYLKGDPAQPWITEGETYLDHQKALGK